MGILVAHNPAVLSVHERRLALDRNFERAGHSLIDIAIGDDPLDSIAHTLWSVFSKYWPGSTFHKVQWRAPWCAKCNKQVERVEVRHHPNWDGYLTRVHCHNSSETEFLAGTTLVDVGPDGIDFGIAFRNKEIEDGRQHASTRRINARNRA